MYVEFQLLGSSFVTFARNLIQRIPICTDQTISYAGQNLMINQVIITDNTWLDQESFAFPIRTDNGVQHVPGLRPIIHQEASIHLVRVADLRANATEPSPVFQEVSVDLITSMTILFDDNDDPFLRLRFERLDFKTLNNLIPDDLKEVAEDLVRSRFDNSDRPIDTSSINTVVKGIEFKVTNAGVAGHLTQPVGPVLYVRLEINGYQGPLNVLAWWEGFFNNSVTNHLGNNQWVALMDKSLLEKSIRQRIRDKLDKSDKFDLDSNITVNWTPILGPQFMATFNGEVIDACVCFFNEIDLDVDVFSIITLSLPQQDVLRTFIRTTYDADDAEVFCCALTAGLFWPVVGFIYMADENNPVNFGHYIAGILLAFWIPLIGTAVAAGDVAPTKYFDDIDENCTKLNDEEVRCDQRLNISFSDLGVDFLTTHLAALSEGLLLGGHISSLPSFQWGNFSFLLSEIGWKVSGSCMRGFVVEQSGGLMLYRHGAVAVCSYRVIDDPLQVFNLVGNELGSALEIRVYPNLTPAYIRDPYPCRILIATNVGIRIVSLGVAANIGTEEATDLELLAKVREGSCPNIIQVFHWQIEAEWLVDPPSDLTRWTEIWQVIVTQLTEFETVSLADDRGRVLADGVATRGGVAHLSAFRDNQMAKSKMVITLDASTEGLRRLEPMMKNGGLERFVFIKQLQLRPIRTIPLLGDFKSFDVDRQGDGYALRVVTTEGSVTYQLSRYANYTVMKAERRRDEAMKSVTQRDQDEKLYSQDSSAEARVSPYRATKRSSRVVYRRDQESLIADLMSREGTKSLPVQPGSAAHVQFIRHYGLKHALYVQATGEEGAVYDFTSEEGARKIADYYHRPWFDGSIRIGDLYARLDDDMKAIQLYRIDAIREK